MGKLLGHALNSCKQKTLVHAFLSTPHTLPHFLFAIRAWRGHQPSKRYEAESRDATEERKMR